jgi:DNA processing protein
MREPFDADDPRTARAAWSRLAEPGDAQAAALVAAHGPVATLRRVLDGAPGTQRWAARLPDLAPGRDLAQLQRWGGRLVCPGDAGWPAALDDLGSRRPFCLWVRGPLDLAAACAGRAVAVVGARAATAYGEHVAGEVAAGAAERGFTVVSGGAYGIDGAAHRAALAVEGPTVAVLACGVERAYPRGHEALLTRIAARGAVVSEVPPGSAPTRWRFLERNRLIAALAAATVVVEAAWRSGALSTAGEAARLLRPVGAVPGPVTSAASAGCHRLLREQGAVCVTDAAEVVELAGRLGDDLAPTRPVRREDVDDLDPDDLRLYEALPLRRGRDAGSIGRVAGLEAAVVRAGLARLELRGLAEHVQQATGAEPEAVGPLWRRARRPPGRDR